MVLCLKTWESRSSPGLRSTRNPPLSQPTPTAALARRAAVRVSTGAAAGRRQKRNQIAAGWSSPVARQAHNLKAAGSNPAPATIATRNHLKLSNSASAWRRPSPRGRLSALRRNVSAPRRQNPAEPAAQSLTTDPRCHAAITASVKLSLVRRAGVEARMRPAALLRRRMPLTAARICAAVRKKIHTSQCSIRRRPVPTLTHARTHISPAQGRSARLAQSSISEGLRRARGRRQGGCASGMNSG